MEKRARFAMVAVTVAFAWLSLRLHWAFDDLWHYGYDRTVLDKAAIWLAAATAALYFGVTVMLWLRLEQAGAAARITAVPAVLASAYTLYTAAAHGSKIGFSAGSLALLGGLTLFAAVAAALRLPRLDLPE